VHTLVLDKAFEWPVPADPAWTWWSEDGKHADPETTYLTAGNPEFTLTEDGASHWPMKQSRPLGKEGDKLLPRFRALAKHLDNPKALRHNIKIFAQDFGYLKGALPLPHVWDDRDTNLVAGLELSPTDPTATVAGAASVYVAVPGAASAYGDRPQAGEKLSDWIKSIETFMDLNQRAGNWKQEPARFEHDLKLAMSGLYTIEPCIDPETGTWTMRASTRTLLGCIWLRFFMDVMTAKEWGRCHFCGDVFAMHHGHAKYCCSNHKTAMNRQRARAKLAGNGESK
jgi:hypothetical protein